ncbi:carbohydrate ABC transporter permease [Anaerocolumna xylanovorans]|uniref:Carbohydrate ABC transporter membrane protein 2, CUT1 family (TC 3.A.1.1.-) n=1 Tax=Anaerocolumna xylanovorans DSM 12503 TaxID=1121345 RepID=A0A1M7YCV9_9FIRM|nr:carbohydrate ABC transporter permease [Anaerocolumna xylanovorans]SHO50480.1 carbohydrate ABC transporter membrane protein 2, CUT1 family (TC 3.A.1.1.-) [Anaerocolumna xylanovorans DSM 12503]
MGKFRNKSSKSKVAAIIKYLFLTAGAVVSLYPFIWVLLSSLKDNNEIYSNSFGLPKIIRWSNYTQAWNGARVGTSFFNSLIVSLSSVILLVVITAMGSYILTRVHKSTFLSVYLSLGIMIPIHAMLIPSVIIFKHLHLQDNLVSLVLVYIATNISFSLYIMKGFMDRIPRELDEAATIDGCGQAGIFFRVIFPIAKPGMATVATLAFLNCWNDLLLGLVLISDPMKRTLSMGISALKGSYVTRYGLLCSGFVISIVPVVIMYLMFQKQVVQGMTAGAVKG